MNALAALFAALAVAGSAIPYVRGPSAPERPQIDDPAVLRAVLTADVLTDKSEFILLSISPQATKDVLYEELMAQLKANPNMALDVWQAALLGEYGEAIHISRKWPDGHEVTLNELMAMMDEFALPKHGKHLSYEEVLALKGITVRRYWAPKNSN